MQICTYSIHRYIYIYLYIYIYIQHANLLYCSDSEVKERNTYLEQLILFKLAVVQAIGVKSVAFECKTEELHLIEQSITRYFHSY